MIGCVAPLQQSHRWRAAFRDALYLALSSVTVEFESYETETKLVQISTMEISIIFTLYQSKNGAQFHLTSRKQDKLNSFQDRYAKVVMSV